MRVRDATRKGMREWNEPRGKGKGWDRTRRDKKTEERQDLRASVTMTGLRSKLPMPILMTVLMDLLV